MGLSYTNLTLKNELKGLAVDISALVDTGALFMCVPESVAAQLGFDTSEVQTRVVTLADGSTRLVPVIRPVTIEFENRSYMTEALVLGDEPLIGCIPMEAMDVIIDPRSQKMIVNPAHPNFPVAHVK